MKALYGLTLRRSQMTAKAIIQMPGEGKKVHLGGQPMAFLVTGDDTRHTFTEATLSVAFFA